jgi:hypothetical protein
VPTTVAAVTEQHRAIHVRQAAALTGKLLARPENISIKQILILDREVAWGTVDSIH